MDSLSVSNTLSKETDSERTEMSTAYFDDLKCRENAAISNEAIRNGDPILETYKVTSDAIHGGMGSVWRVYHQAWDTDLAMKRPQPRFFAEGGDERKEQFIKECENWINLGLHPNIVSCYYVREIGGVPTIFSEWMNNGSLKDRIADGSLYENSEKEVQERILNIAIQAARGLQYSHENGLIHQDMKPGNLLLTGDWDAKVADFGLAKAKEQLDEKSDLARTTGYTLAYCPEEQSNGEKPQRWMDVYAWALTVLEMYAGKRLWDTGAEVKTHFDEYLSKCLYAVPLELAELLRTVMTAKKDGFHETEQNLLDIYENTFGRRYPFDEIKAAPDMAASLNNRAVSMIDLGKNDVAERLLELAVTRGSSDFVCQYNMALFLWKNKRIDYNELRDRVRRYCDGEQKSEELVKMIEGIGIKEVPDYRWENSPDYWAIVSNESSSIRYRPEFKSKPEYWEKQPEEKIVSKRDPEAPDKRSFACRVFLNENKQICIEKDGRTILVPGEELRDISTDCKKALYHKEYHEKDCFSILDLESGDSRRVDFYIPKHMGVYNMSFVGMEGKIVAAETSFLGNLLLIETNTGRSLSSVLYPKSEGYYPGGHVEGFQCPDGPIRYRPNGLSSLALSMPKTGCEPPYVIKRLKTYREIVSEQDALSIAFSAAKEAYEYHDYDRVMELLGPYCLSGAIVHHEEALLLWTGLGSFFEPVKLVAVVPTEDAPVPDPVQYQPFVKAPWTDRRCTNNGIVKLKYECSYEEFIDDGGMAYCNMTWSLTGFDAADESRRVFDIPVFCTYTDSEIDTGEFFNWDTGLFLHFLQDGTLCWGKKNERGKLEDPEVQKGFSEGMVFYLPAGVELQNTREGLRIGSLLFDDEFEGCYPLYNAEIIPGKKQNYRLVYLYGNRREEPLLD